MTGWTCPVCGTGNAPFIRSCCAQPPPTITTTHTGSAWPDRAADGESMERYTPRGALGVDYESEDRRLPKVPTWALQQAEARIADLERRAAAAGAIINVIGRGQHNPCEDALWATAFQIAGALWAEFAPSAVVDADRTRVVIERVLGAAPSQPKPEGGTT